jgi:hypothetical protein
VKGSAGRSWVWDGKEQRVEQMRCVCDMLQPCGYMPRCWIQPLFGTAHLRELAPPPHTHTHPLPKAARFFPAATNLVIGAIAVVAGSSGGRVSRCWFTSRRPRPSRRGR